MQEIKTILTTAPKEKPAQNNLGFGNYFTDHMFMMDYEEGKGWYDPRIVPYSPISLEPSAMVFHYAQEVFEGLKAYRTEDDKILLFRPDKNMARLNQSNDRLAIPFIDEKFAVEAMKALINVDKSWVPSEKDTSLYVRPFIIAVDPYLGVRAANHYLFMIILSPVGAYYPEGLNPVKIFVENSYVRAVKGGVGHTKTGGNYASSIKAQLEAKKQHYTQVLWLDGVDRKYIEEVGTMNVFFKIGGKIITPELGGSILDGVTRRSVIEMLMSFGLTVEERKLSIEEVAAASEDGTLEEAFGTGTAAVISPIGELNWNGKIMKINDEKIGGVSQRLYDELTGIQWGKKPDVFGWTVEVD